MRRHQAGGRPAECCWRPGGSGGEKEQGDDGLAETEVYGNTGVPNFENELIHTFKEE